MKQEVIDYYQTQGYHVPDMIDRGKGAKWRVKPKQVEMACEYTYLQIKQGLEIARIDLARYTLNKAKQLRIGRYYKVNLGDPVLLDDLTAIHTLEDNLLAANEENLRLHHNVLCWQLGCGGLFMLTLAVLANMVIKI